MPARVNVLFFMLLQLSHFSPFSLLHAAHPHYHRQSPHCCPRPCVLHVCFLTDSFPFFQPVPTCPLTAANLFHESMPLFLFRSLISLLLLSNRAVSFTILPMDRSHDSYTLSIFLTSDFLGIFISFWVDNETSMGYPIFLTFLILCETHD